MLVDDCNCYNCLRHSVSALSLMHGGQAFRFQQCDDAGWESKNSAPAALKTSLMLLRLPPICGANAVVTHLVVRVGRRSLAEMAMANSSTGVQPRQL